MKTYYAVHNDKTHVKVDSLADFVARFSTESDWKMIEADSEGWIAHTGKVCPLPDDVRCAIKCADGSTSTYSHKARQWGWETSGEMSDITHYKPILTEKVQERYTADEYSPWDAALTYHKGDKVIMPDGEKTVIGGEKPALQYDPRSVSFNLIDRLKAAHEAAQTIPDLEAELREVLGSMGYDLVSRSPFVEPEPAVETPQDNKYAAEW